MRLFIHEGTQHYWEQALAEPARHADWIVLNNAESGQASRDKVAHRLLAEPQLLEPYELKYKDGGLEMYRLVRK
jgi:hypothetical protein